ncbi:hypothetical protein [Geopsychrobacter electrodiphilus]|uniref:hypothetical protein n=1 Tax=Geopsychrobacter electrodiphilus TaxID=225196 RepID=UPI000368446D|nr:hypothetical protein [Geopsychrobacter electrodiphilus]
MFSPRACRSLSLALIALLTALSLSSCLGTRPDTAELVPFTSDGCSLFPDGTFRDRDKWCDCCLNHDLAYWQGGSAEARDRADVTLRDCVLTRTNDPHLAETMYLGARLGGLPDFPTWYRWGYGWPYGRGYQPLSDLENIQVQKQLAVYARQHPTGYCTEKKIRLHKGPG